MKILDFENFIFNEIFRCSQFFSADDGGGIGIEINKKLVGYIDLSNKNIHELENMYRKIEKVVPSTSDEEDKKNLLLNTVNMWYKSALDKKPETWIWIWEDSDSVLEKTKVYGYMDLKGNWIKKKKEKALNAGKIDKYIKSLENRIKILEEKVG